MKKYILVEDYKSLNVEDERQGKETYRDFKKNELVDAEEVRVEQNPGSGKYIQAILVDDKYIIPKNAAIEYSEAEKIAEGKKTVSEKVKKISESFFREKNKQIEITRHKSYRNGAIVGALLGIVGGIYFKKNIFLSATIGLFSGGYVASKFKDAQHKGKKKAGQMFVIK